MRRLNYLRYVCVAALGSGAFGATLAQTSGASEPADSASWPDTTSHVDGWLGPAWNALSNATYGTVEAGSFIGTPPFTLGDQGQWGVFAKGEVGLHALGVPIQARFDLGTDLASRGQRNRLTFQFDPSRLQKAVTDRNTASLDSISSALDSLRLVEGELYRAWKSLDQSIPEPDLIDTSATSYLPTAPLTPPTSTIDSLTNPLPPVASPTLGNTPPEWTAASVASQLSHLRELIAALEQKKELAEAIDGAAREPSNGIKVLQAVRSLQIGTCSPAHSVFLIRGLTLTGITTEVATKELYFAFDHGRSYDDAWRNQNATQERLRSIQQSFLFQDPEDLNPRRLTAVKAGIGAPEGNHFHLGFLNGKRQALPFGLEVDDPNRPDEVNQVVELDAGVLIGKTHSLALTMGHSAMTSTGAELGENETSLFERKGPRNIALQAKWRSRFARTGTTLEVEGRTIDAGFHSMGLAFLRSGSNSLSAHLDQQVKKKLKLRLGVRQEVRMALNADATTSTLKRINLGCTYKPYKWISMRATYAPLFVHTEMPNALTLTQSNSLLQTGIDVRRRVGRSNYSLTMDATQFGQRTSPEMPTTTIWSWMAAASYSKQDRWGVDLLTTSIEGQDSLSTITSITGRAHISTSRNDMVQIELNAAATTLDAVGWTVSWRHVLGKQCSLNISANHIADPIYFSTSSYEDTNVDHYTCRASIGFSW
jgi:hypothetical protein